MRINKVRYFPRVLRVLLILSLALLITGPALAAGYPRRIAIAPFVSLAKEDIGSTVAVLPRLMASRLMALAGADVLLLPAGGKSPAEAAGEAKYPLLLQGTVSKLGKGYSIDAVVTDLADGKSAGAFFAAAATEDDIIAQLGVMSGEIAEKVFGVQGAVRAVTPAPAALAPAAVPVVIPSAVPSAVGVAAAPAGQVQPAVSLPASGATTLAGGWVPSSVKKIGQSDKIIDELYGVVTVAKDAEGSDLVVAYGRNTLYIYKVKGEEILPYSKIRRSLDHHFLAVDAFDVDGDGVKEILVTDLIEESVQSFILKKKGDGFEEMAEKLRYYLIVLPDWNGKPTLVGQYQGVDNPFQGKILTLRWDGKSIVAGAPLPHDTNLSPLTGGATGLSSARFGTGWRLIYTDEESYLRILDGDGRSSYKSRTRYGTGADFFEWGPIIEIEGRRRWIPVNKPARLAPGSGENPLVMTTEIKKGMLDLVGGSYDSTRLVFLLWEGGEFLEKAGTQGTSQFLTGADFLSTSGFSKGGRTIASTIEQTGALKDKISRLYLYQVE